MGYGLNDLRKALEDCNMSAALKIAKDIIVTSKNNPEIIAIVSEMINNSYRYDAPATRSHR